MKSKIEYLQLYLLYFDNNQFENNCKIVFKLTKSDKSLNFLDLKIVKSCYNQ